MKDHVRLVFENVFLNLFDRVATGRSVRPRRLENAARIDDLPGGVDFRELDAVNFRLRGGRFHMADHGHIAVGEGVDERRFAVTAAAHQIETRRPGVDHEIAQLVHGRAHDLVFDELHDLHRYLDGHRVDHLLEQTVDRAEQTFDLFLVDRHYCPQSGYEE